MKSKKKARYRISKFAKKPWPLAQNVAFLDKVEFERRFISNVSPFSPPVNETHAADDDVDENEEDVEPISKTNAPSTSRSYAGKRIRSNADNLVAILAKRTKERDTLFANIHSQQEKVLNTKDYDVDLFLKSITETLKKFPKKGISEAKLKVLSLVSELEDKYDGPEISGSAYNPVYPPQDNSPNSIPKPTLFTPYNYAPYTQIPEPQDFTNFAQYDTSVYKS
ncbi:hypothetical protein AGLY_009415 [Aphis glycines]|uniref:BESS domain-containing protein n=1 Tax=Aphis glycines TaxID=307491 RepID=A0A6G0TIN7_APHGL|nr:hypothetical protein AGLY_009415 [Aphis glycines]